MSVASGKEDRKYDLQGWSIWPQGQEQRLEQNSQGPELASQELSGSQPQGG